MKTLAAVVAALAACGLASVADAQAPIGQDRQVTLPMDASQLIERLALCDHLAGEYDAPGSPRTAEVSAAVERHRCGQLDQALKDMKRKYAGDPAVLRALAQAESKRPE